MLQVVLRGANYALQRSDTDAEPSKEPLPSFEKQRSKTFSLPQEIRQSQEYHNEESYV